MKTWRILRLIFLWFNTLLKAMFLIMTGFAFLAGGLILLPKVYDVLEEAQLSWEPAIGFLAPLANWGALTFYDWAPVAFFMVCLVWGVVFFIKGLRG